MGKDERVWDFITEFFCCFVVFRKLHGNEDKIIFFFPVYFDNVVFLVASSILQYSSTAEWKCLSIFYSWEYDSFLKSLFLYHAVPEIGIRLHPQCNKSCFLHQVVPKKNFDSLSRTVIASTWFITVRKIHRPQ